MEKIEYYLSLLEKSASASMLICNNCGSRTVSKNTLTHCNFCELEINRTNPIDYPLEKFKKIATLIDNEKINDAIASLDELSKGISDPTASYVLAIFYEFVSNYKYYKLNYYASGFMEENSLNIYSSLDMTSKSKEFFFRALKLIHKTEQKDTANVFLEFMANMKLHRHFNAAKALEEIKKDTTMTNSFEYAQMLTGCFTKSKDSTLKIQKSIENSEINAFYYLSMTLAENKRISDAIKLLSMLTKKARIPMAFYLLIKIKNVNEAMEL